MPKPPMNVWNNSKGFAFNVRVKLDSFCFQDWNRNFHQQQHMKSLILQLLAQLVIKFRQIDISVSTNEITARKRLRSFHTENVSIKGGLNPLPLDSSQMTYLLGYWDQTSGTPCFGIQTLCYIYFCNISWKILPVAAFSASLFHASLSARNCSSCSILLELSGRKQIPKDFQKRWKFWTRSYEFLYIRFGYRDIGVSRAAIWQGYIDHGDK